MNGAAPTERAAAPVSGAGGRLAFWTTAAVGALAAAALGGAVGAWLQLEPDELRPLRGPHLKLAATAGLPPAMVAESMGTGGSRVTSLLPQHDDQADGA